jgi:hypothetical protein
VREREVEIFLRGRRCTAGWVVKKDSCRTMSKCRVLSGSIGRSGWSIGYSLWTREERQSTRGHLQIWLVRQMQRSCLGRNRIWEQICWRRPERGRVLPLGGTKDAGRHFGWGRGGGRILGSVQRIGAAASISADGIVLSSDPPSQAPAGLRIDLIRRESICQFQR